MKEGIDLVQNIETMKNVDLRTVDPAELVDIRDVKIDLKLSGCDRLIDFILQIKNPYCYKCGKAVVKISFAETGATLEDRLESYLLSL
jgi:hypothetical protein